MTATRVVHVQKVSGVSGSENHLLSLLPGLRARGWEAEMVVLHEGEPGAASFGRALRERGVPVEAVRLRGDADPAAFARLAAGLARRRADVVHTHLVHGDLYGLPAAALARVPARVSTKHGFNEFRSRRAFAAADRAVARLAHVHVAISRGLAEYLAEAEGFEAEAFRVVHYGIEPGERWQPYAGSEPRLACVGRLIPVKGHATLLRALADARTRVPGLSLELAGEGALEPELRALAAELQLEAVAFLGRVAPIAPVFERAAIVVVPSLGEGFGMVALEAMERGRAVIASAVGGLPEIVEDGTTGLLVPPGDSAALCAALVELAGDLDRARAMGEAGRARALERFGASRCVERTIALYEEALAR